MPVALELWEQPQEDEIYMIIGWRQWADAGSVSSGLPQYLIEQTKAKQIGVVKNDGFYLFQIPGTHDLVRPVVNFTEGYPERLETQRNELYFTNHQGRGVVIFIGDEPHLDVERYVANILQAVKTLHVKRIIGLGGVYGELPYNKDRLISSIYSMPKLKGELTDLAVNLSDYQGGASIGSYLCRRAGDQDVEYLSFYAFVPTYDISSINQVSNTIRIENDYMAWLGIMKRINHMLKLELDLSDLEGKSDHLIELMDSKVEELDRNEPQLGMRAFLDRLENEFNEIQFNPLDAVWEEELRRLFNKLDPDDK
ncbi:MAG: PAC2 family protein [Anaerolineales bacterium]|nr:PAC2 family protein [Anaerolineales bacterium]